MLFTIYPEFSKGRVNRAGDSIRKDVATLEDEQAIENWRASHNYVLNTFQATLRRHARDKQITVAQRLKRKTTIYDKLTRQPRMQLARMHDIAGCRLIFEDLDTLNETRDRILNSSFKHIRKNSKNDYNYVEKPKESGYRGIHDVYEYQSYTGKSNNWNGLLVELQYRTKVQHSWATAVEIFGALTGFEAKFDRAQEIQQRFFVVASELLARHFENCANKFLAKSYDELLVELNELEEETQILRLLEGLHVSATNLKNVRNIILVMQEGQQLDAYGYNSAKAAIDQYFFLESKYQNADIVLVRADSNEGVRSAFRNYFSDARDFTANIRYVLNSR